MCGIAITYGFEPECIDKMLDSQHHRGKDNTGKKVFDSGVCMGHNRLSIIDLSESSNQPLNVGFLNMVYNGEIYNYNRRVKSDSLHLLNTINTSPKWFDEVEGMFAVATYNTKSNQIKLTCDAFGQKPIYYYFDGQRFAAASTPAALTTLKDKWELDRDAVDSLFALGGVMGERSMFKGIKRLLGGHQLTFELNAKKISIRKWYEPKYANKPEHIEELIYKAIDEVKVSDVPIHLFLSGGIDSTLIASRLRNSKALHLFSEELSYAKKAAKKYGITLSEVPIKADLSQIRYNYAKTTGDCAMSCVQPYLVSEALAKHGKVGIIANGADELFFGYDRMQWTIEKQLANIFRPNYKPYVNELLDAYSGIDFPLNRFFELFGYVQFDLNKTLDFASMCHTVEMRSPFLNRELVECSMMIPKSTHTDNGRRGKDILKRILERQKFDSSFIDRSKVGFSLPKYIQYDGQPDLRWCIREGYCMERNDWSGRDLIYSIATASAFRQWFNAWEGKLA